MYKKLWIFLTMLLSVIQVAPGWMPRVVASIFEREKTPEEPQKLLRALAEYLEVHDQTTECMRKIRTPKYKQVEVMKMVVPLSQALHEANVAIDKTIKALKEVKYIEPNDLERAQQNLPWLQKPIATFIVNWFSKEGIYRKSDQHILNLLKPYINPIDEQEFQRKINYGECCRSCRSGEGGEWRKELRGCLQKCRDVQ